MYKILFIILFTIVFTEDSLLTNSISLRKKAWNNGAKTFLLKLCHQGRMEF